MTDAEIAAQRDLALWLHAESEWWLAQYKHDVVVWRQQLTTAEERIAAADTALDAIDRRCECEVVTAHRVRAALHPVGSPADGGAR